MGEKNRALKITGYFAAFLVPVLVMLFVIYMASAYPFGDASILYGDANDQYYAMYGEFIRWFKSGDFSSILWDRGLGADFYANMLYYGMSPLNIIIILLGEEHLKLSMVFLIFIKTGLLTLSAYHFFLNTDRYKGGDERFKTGLSFALACSYGLSGYVLAYGHSIMWLDGLIMLPLIALAIERLTRGEGAMRYSLLLGLTIIFNFYFAIFVCIFSVLYYFICLDKASVRNIAGFAVSSFTAALLAAVVLVPTLLNTMQGSSYDDSYNNAVIPAIGNICSFLESFYPMQSLDADGGYLYAYNNYCGTFVLLAFVLFMIIPGDKKIKIKYGIVLGLLAVAENVKVFNFIFHGFTYPHGLSNRFAFILIFMLLVMSCRFLSELNEIDLKHVGITMASVAGVAIFFAIVNIERSTASTYGCFFLTLALYGVLLVLVAIKGIKISTFKKIIVGIWCLEVIVSAVIVAPDKRMSSGFEDFTGLKYYEDTYEGLSVTNGERKSSLSTADNMNMSDVNWYSSMGNGSASDSFRALGLSYYQTMEYTYRGTTPVSALLYNVRYVMTRESGTLGGYHYVETRGTENETGMYLYEADNLCGAGFVVDENIESWEPSDNVFENQNSLMKLACGMDEDIFTEVKPSDMAFQVMNIEADNLTENTCEYTGLTGGTSALLLSFTADTDMDLYLFSSDSRQQLVEIYVNGSCVMSNEYMETASVSHGGEINAGDVIIIALYSGAAADEQGIKTWKLYSFNQDAYEAAYEVLNDETLSNVSTSGNEMSAYLDCGDDGMLYLSIPYSKGYKVCVDGKETSLIKIGSGLSGVKVTAGSHNIEISYHTPGMTVGIIISVLTLIGLIIFKIIMSSACNKNRQAESCPEDKASQV